MILTILGVYSFIILIVMSVGSILANLKRGIKVKDYVFMLMFLAPVFVYILITVVQK